MYCIPMYVINHIKPTFVEVGFPSNILSGYFFLKICKNKVVKSLLIKDVKHLKPSTLNNLCFSLRLVLKPRKQFYVITLKGYCAGYLFMTRKLRKIARLWVSLTYFILSKLRSVVINLILFCTHLALLISWKENMSLGNHFINFF